MTNKAFKKFNDNEMNVLREAVQDFIQARSDMTEEGFEDSKNVFVKSLKVAEKVQKKLVHCYYYEIK
tara:strand:- start:916 stop:1116 length:201 start_codon:yes stop_codon:yes gene_type:complete